MQRVVNTVEKNVVVVPISPIIIPPATPIDVLQNIISAGGEYAGRYIQNVGANDCFYAYGHDCDPTNYNGILTSGGGVDKGGQQFDASNCGQRLSVYSTGGTKIAVTLLKRNDNAQGQGGIIPGNAHK